MKTNTPSIQVLERMMHLLNALANRTDPVSLKELAQTTELHPSTAHRILNDLVTTGLINRTHNGHYRLGIRLLELGNLVKNRINVREVAFSFMQTLHEKTHQTINLALRQDDEIVYIDRAFSERSGMQVVRAIGGRAPLHLTSSGKLFLSHDDPAAIHDYIHRTGLPGHNHHSITQATQLLKELDTIRKNGFARDNEELEIGVQCIAAGIYDEDNKLIAGLSISAPTGRLNELWLTDLINTARQISNELGNNI
jgi:DNA-binding IclR family transcriptional regulator